MKAREVLPMVLTASTASFIAGAGYILDCRAAGGPVKDCWFTGLPIAGIGASAGAGFRLGYETLNPHLRKPDDVG
jgi:hypothetical protein